MGDEFEEQEQEQDDVQEEEQEEIEVEPDAVEVTEEEKPTLKGAMCGALLSPIFILTFTILVGWNEKRAVCGAEAINAAEAVAAAAKCDAVSGEGNLVVISGCDLAAATTPLKGAGLFGNVAHTGHCLSTEPQMYQCVETTSSTKSGGKTTTTYTYDKKWSESTITAAFSHPDKAKTKCGASTNPAWPSDIKAKTTYSSSAKVGAWTLQEEDIKKVVSCDRAMASLPAAPSGYTKGTSRSNSVAAYKKNSPAFPALGAIEVEFYSDDTSKTTKVTIMGKNVGGVLKEWTSPDTWLCSGMPMKTVRTGAVDKATLFQDLRTGNTVMTWFLRFLFWLLLWSSCTALFRPLEVLASMVPFVGDFLGDLVEAIICCITCLPATACCMFVAAIVWVAMRPLIGIPMFLFAVIGGGTTAYFTSKAANKKRAAKEGCDSCDKLKEKE